MLLSYDEIRTELQSLLVQIEEKADDEDSCVLLVKSLAERHCSSGVIDADWRNILELVLRERAVVLTGAVSDNDTISTSSSSSACDGHHLSERLSEIRHLITMCVRLADCDVLSHTSPILLLTDCFDLLPVTGCQCLFDYVEHNVDVWKRPAFFNACKNNILRMCNDLLRRQSQSQNTVFCGRVLLFLAKFFPLSERSGLNVISEFNLDNAPTYDTCDAAVVDKDGTGAELEGLGGADSNLDYNFYAKFWSLQEFFRNPNQCYDNSAWLKFTRSTEEVLTVFAGYRDEQSSQNSSPDQNMDVSMAGENGSTQTQYFAKFLTSPKLLHLQLMDAAFRRFILVQFLILFDYLVSQVKFKTETQVLSGEQRGWLDLVRDRVFSLLANTRPDGEALAQSIRSLLQHERSWNAWKNDGCAAFTLTKDHQTEPAAGTDDKESTNNGRLPAARTRPRRRVGDVLRQAHAKRRHLLGNAELSRLWNVCPDNMAACRSSQRDFLPSMDSFFEEAIVQLDPASMVEPQYRLVNDAQFGWRALRLLSRRCSHYFAASQKIPNSQADYLETILKKVAADSLKNSVGDPVSGATPGGTDGNLTVDSVDELSTSTAAGASAGNSAAVADGREEEERTAADGVAVDDTATRQLHPIDEEMVRELSQHLGDGWKRLAPKLGAPQHEVSRLESEYCEETGQPELAAESLLTFWLQREGTEACQEELLYALGAVKLDLPQVRALFHPAVVGDVIAN